MNEAIPAIMNTIAEVSLVFLAILFRTKHKTNTVALADPFATNQPVLPMLFFNDEVIWATHIPFVSLPHDSHLLNSIPCISF